MASSIRAILNVFIEFGFDPRRTIRSLRALPFFLRDLWRYRRLAGWDSQALPVGAVFPILSDRFAKAGVTSGHYFHQDLWAARKIHRAAPVRHVDVGSSIAGFVSHCLSFREMEVVDIRPLANRVEGLRFIQGDATRLDGFVDNSLESISSLHAGEHFGLGRYGDRIDPMAHLQFMASLARVLKPGGRLYYAIPCGREKLYFNAHRILAPETVLKAFGNLKLLSFSCVKDDGDFYPDCSPEVLRGQCYGCGLFEFTK